jgi:hypothetical protein
MKNMKWAITFIFLMNGIFLSAQNIAIGARGGISIPNLSSSGSEKNPLNTGYSSRLGPEFGVFMSMQGPLSGFCCQQNRSHPEPAPCTWILPDKMGGCYRGSGL